jgi:hypothetical protein
MKLHTRDNERNLGCILAESSTQWPGMINRDAILAELLEIESLLQDDRPSEAASLLLH